MKLRILIAEDDLYSRKYLFKLLSRYGECDLVVDGMEALDAFLLAEKENSPYDLICLDIILPKIDGVKVLKHIRDLEKQKDRLSKKQSKIIMTTALAQTQLVQKAFDIGCDAYAAKPINTEKLLKVLNNVNLIKDTK